MNTTESSRKQMEFVLSHGGRLLTEDAINLLSDFRTLEEKIAEDDIAFLKMSLYISNLEQKCAWQAKMLERAKESFTDVALRIAKREPQDMVSHAVWLSDYEKGPK